MITGGRVGSNSGVGDLRSPSLTHAEDSLTADGQGGRCATLQDNLQEDGAQPYQGGPDICAE